jgi:hypothetical protein
MKRLASLLLGATAVLVGAHQANQRPPTFRPLDGGFFIVTKNHYAEGFGPTGLTARFGDVILIGFLDRKQPGWGRIGGQDPGRVSTYYEKKYFQAGKEFPLFHGGTAVGSVRVEKVVPLQCDSSAAVASIQGGLQLGNEDFAIATTAAVASHANRQQPATSSQTRVVERWARSYLRSKAVHGDLKTERLLQTVVSDTKEELLIGDLSLKSKTELRSILVVGRAVDDRFYPELVRDHRTTDVEDAKDFEPESFADQLDLDGDKVDEIIAEQTGYESEQFVVYKRDGKTWRRVWIGGQGGC